MMDASEISTNTSPLKLQSEEPFLGFASSGSLSGLTGDDLSQKFENIALRSSEEDSVDGSRSDHSGSDGGRLNPLRPYAEDCSFYLRTGRCKFGLNCKFNHPLRRANQKVGKEGEDKEKDMPKTKEGLSEKSEQIECKYYLTPGGCKYGKSCRYNHLKDESEIVPPELNFLGLPIRLGERECPFYMRTGSCGYGARCKFHHPDPTSVGAYGPHNSSPNNESIGQYGLHSGNDNVYIPSRVSWASQPAQASWSSPMLSDKAVPYQDNHPSYMATKHFLSPGALQTPEWNRYQAPIFPEQKAIHPHSAPVAKSLPVKADGPSQFEEFPERPGQPECDYFLKTGDCKFRSACKYHHPKIQAPREDCALSDKGLPLRPGKRICWHYEQFGICKYGRACLFDHPVSKSSTPVGSVLKFP